MTAKKKIPEHASLDSVVAAKVDAGTAWQALKNAAQKAVLLVR